MHICFSRKWPSSWTNENILFTKSAITSECHNIFGWNRKHFNGCLGQTMPLSILIFWQSLWPQFYPKCSNLAQNALFPYFSELFLVLLLKYPWKPHRVSQWVRVWHFQPKRKFFFQGWAPKGSRSSPNWPKIACFSRFTPICWNISHKLLLSIMLIAIRVPLKLFKNKLL